MATVTSDNFTQPPLFMQAVTGDTPIDYTAANFRNITASTWPTGGIITRTSFLVNEAATPGWAVMISPGHAAVGNYLVSKADATTLNLTSFNLNPSATRYHRAWLVVTEKTQGGDGYYARLEITEDTGSGAPVPAGTATLLLGVIAVSPGQTSIRGANIATKPANASHCGPWDLLDNGPLLGAITSAHTQSGTAPARVRYGAGRVWFSGSIKKATGTFGDGTTVLGDLPKYLWPVYPVVVGGTTSGSYGWRLTVAVDGVMSATLPSISGFNPTYLYLEGMSYEID